MTNEESQIAQMHPYDCDCELCREWWEALRRRDMKVHAPWTEKQIAAIDARQDDIQKHPYTCKCGESLTAYPDGWHCDYCHQYTQNWAHSEDMVVGADKDG